ncbi:trypsin-like peptidase domain-containing protein [Balneola sp. MJW-20]|uniref:trypsin-like peptidase domain-containing protein n=1 Tax=Gracilimonas aurantiaca TaxID=3234185 RepID=UPI003466F7F4
MKRRDLILTAVLLVLIGVTMGTLFALYTVNEELAPLAEVRTTEVRKGTEPFITDEQLERADARFIFKKVAESVTPTVVYIEAIVPLETSIPEDENHDLEDDSFWDRIIPRRARTVGSGVIITDDGYILTNYHVVEGAVKKGLKVVLNDKREFSAKLVGVDPSTDLAVIKIKAKDLPTSIIGESETVDVGEWVLAVGNPFRLRSTVTAGIVSALGRDVQIIDDRYRIESFIQTDAAINQGNSGGALVNTSGQLIGINTAIASQTGTYQGYGFAVPIDLAIKVAEDLIEFGRVQRALLGVSIASVDYSRAMEKGMNEVMGVEIIGVERGNAADNAGIEVGDVVLEVNGYPVNESNELQQRVAVLRPGEVADLTLWRDGKRFSKEVSLQMLESEPIAEIRIDDEPMEVEEIPEGSESFESFREFDAGFRASIAADKRVIVSHVYKYSEAWNRGLRENQVILKINDKKVEDLNSLEELMAANFKDNGSVTLEILNEENAKGYIQLKQ